MYAWNVIYKNNTCLFEFPYVLYNNVINVIMRFFYYVSDALNKTKMSYNALGLIHVFIIVRVPNVMNNSKFPTSNYYPSHCSSAENS